MPLHSLAPASLNFPAKQSLQDVAPPKLYLPETHRVHASFPTTPMYVPAEQALQVVSPSTSAYFPISQFVQLVMPMLAAYCPTGHNWQLNDDERYVPAAQDESHSEEAAIEKRPTGQSSHALAPLPDFLPATQPEQVMVAGTEA